MAHQQSNQPHPQAQFPINCTLKDKPGAMATYLDVGLCGEVVCLVLEIERVEPLIEREVETKVKIRMTPDSLRQSTYKTLLQ